MWLYTFSRSCHYILTISMWLGLSNVNNKERPKVWLHFQWCKHFQLMIYLALSQTIKRFLVFINILKSSLGHQNRNQLFNCYIMHLFRLYNQYEIWLCQRQIVLRHDVSSALKEKPLLQLKQTAWSFSVYPHSWQLESTDWQSKHGISLLFFK